MKLHEVDALNVNDILAQPSGLYSGTDATGQSVIITREKGHGFVIMTPTHNDWYACDEYDESGNLVGTTYVK